MKQFLALRCSGKSAYVVDVINYVIGVKFFHDISDVITGTLKECRPQAEAEQKAKIQEVLIIFRPNSQISLGSIFKFLKARLMSTLLICEPLPCFTICCTMWSTVGKVSKKGESK